MTRRRPPKRIITERSRNNAKRKLMDNAPTAGERDDLAAFAKYGPYSKHKLNPQSYGLDPYAGPDEDRTYCDAHANFLQTDASRIPLLMKRGIQLGLWAVRGSADVPRLLWTIDDNGWIYELRITNATQAEYHGYPLLPGDAFTKQLLARAREAAFPAAGFTINNDPNVQAAILAAEAHYR